MFKRWLEFLAKHRAAPEESVTYRVAVTVLVMFCLVVTLHQIEWPSYWPAVLILTPAASVLSYYRRSHSNVWLKVFLSFAMVALLLWFFLRLSRTLYDPRIPLAELLIWLQTLHAFDLPAKKDLRYTGLVALILIAIACVLTYSSNFVPILLLFCAMFLGVLAIDFWAGNRTPNTVLTRASHELGTRKPWKNDASWLGGTIARALPLSILGAGLIFLFMPRYQGLNLRSLPVNWNIQFSLSKISGGEIVNQATQDRTETDSGGKPVRIDGDSYFGFDSTVNLNARGKLSDKLVLKVRTSNWQYHRGVTFTEYTGGGWKGLPWEPESKTISSPPFYFRSVNWQDERITIYYAETDLPNIIFTPSNPRRLYFPSDEIFTTNSFRKSHIPKNAINTPATVISPFFLEEGVVYSALNQVPATTPRMLSLRRTQVDLADPPQHLVPFLQLPESVSDRTRKLARELCEGKESEWARAAALTTYLQQNYHYKLEVPFYPQDADTADHFLFEAKEGYCEQFATSLCVMARSVGLPSRYVTGYLPGTFNPISGFYEIKASDAHAWTEIYFEGYGWMIFDPVPGGDPNPQLSSTDKNTWLLESFLDYLNLPPALKENLPTVIRVFVGLAVLSLLLALFRRRSSGQEIQESELAPYLKRAEALLEPRAQGETVRDWSLRQSSAPDLVVLADIYEQSFYRGEALTKEQRASLETLLSKLEKLDSV